MAPKAQNVYHLVLNRKSWFLFYSIENWVAGCVFWHTFQENCLRYWYAFTSPLYRGGLAFKSCQSPKFPKKECQWDPLMLINVTLIYPENWLPFWYYYHNSLLFKILVMRNDVHENCRKKYIPFIMLFILNCYIKMMPDH